MDSLFSISALQEAAAAGRTRARVHAQVASTTRKETKDGKPFWEVALADALGKLTLRAWSDAPAFPQCANLQTNAFLEVRGEFSLGNFGLESRDWQCRELSPEERQQLLAGPPEQHARLAADFSFLETSVASMAEPRLQALCTVFLKEFRERLLRTGAARGNHHARRGGLVEHTAQILRSAFPLAAVYPTVHRDLLIAGVLFHDCGKLWENSYLADGFTMPFTELGELLGHIPVGMEFVNSLWNRLLRAPENAGWASLTPSNDSVRLHLLHLVASHHGAMEFGSPVVPKTPEAWVLHYVDNLDAKMEMMAHSYVNPKAPTIFERVWPLPGNSVTPLPLTAAPGQPA